MHTLPENLTLSKKAYTKQGFLWEMFWWPLLIQQTVSSLFAYCFFTCYLYFTGVLALKEGVLSAMEKKHHKEREMLEELITASKDPSAIAQTTKAAINLGMEVRFIY